MSRHCTIQGLRNRGQFVSRGHELFSREPIDDFVGRGETILQL